MKKISILCLFLGLGMTTIAQQQQQNANAEQYKKVQQLANLGQCKDGLAIIEGLVKQDSSNANYLAYNSYLLAKVWHDKQLDEGQTMPHYNVALNLAKKAIKLDSNNAETQYCYAFTVGVMNEFASNKQQLANAQIMKNHIDKCLKLNPQHSGAYHLLGRWSRRIAEFNGVEKFAVKTLYGTTLPVATFQDAANAFEKAYVYASDYLIHQYELAYTYYEMNKYADAKVWLNQVIANTTYKGDDAQMVKDKCKKLLEKMN